MYFLRVECNLFATAAGWEAKNEEEILKILIRNQKILGVFKSCVFLHTFPHNFKARNIKKREREIKTN